MEGDKEMDKQVVMINKQELVSNVIAGRMPYRSLEELEQAMRGRRAYSGTA